MEEGKDSNLVNESRMSPVGFIVFATLIASLGAIARFIWLGLKPFHHDEGVNGFFLLRLAREGYYRYDPANYHGPDLYYISLFVTNIIGLDDIGTRSTVAIFGLLTVITAFWLRRHIGDIGALVAAGLIAISPGMVYISRYFIHEILFVFFSLTIPIGVLFFIERRKAGFVAQGLFAVVLGVILLPTQTIIVQRLLGTDGYLALGVRLITSLAVAFLIYAIVKRVSAWRDGTPIHLMLSVVSVCMLFATKETGFITVGTMILSCVSVVVWERLSGRRGQSSDKLSWRSFMDSLGTGNERRLILGISATLFALLWIVFFSSFYTNWKGLIDSITAYAIWTKTGTDAHRNGFWAYLKWMWEIEAPILLLAALGVLFALIGQRNRFVVFASFWALGISLAYTLIPYKTPWLMVSFVLPMTIVGGHAVDEMLRNRLPSVRVLGVLVLSVVVGVAGWQSWSLNFVRFDDQRMPYVYAHTERTFDEMIERIDTLDARLGGKKELRIDIVSSEFWPLPWSLRHYRNAGFGGKIVPANGQDVIIARYRENEEEVLANYQEGYVSLGIFRMRPGVDLILLVRKDVAGPMGEKLELNLLGN